MAAPIGNENNRKGREWTAALRRAMARKADGDFRKTLDKIAERVVEQALEAPDGAVCAAAWKEIAEREDGKAQQSLEVDAGGNLMTLLAGLGRARRGERDRP